MKNSNHLQRASQHCTCKTRRMPACAATCERLTCAPVQCLLDPGFQRRCPRICINGGLTWLFKSLVVTPASLRGLSVPADITEWRRHLLGPSDRASAFELASAPQCPVVLSVIQFYCELALAIFKTLGEACDEKARLSALTHYGRGCIASPTQAHHWHSLSM